MGRSNRTERFRPTRRESMLVPGRTEGWELYDQEKDPGENRNIAYEPDSQELVAELSHRLDPGWKAALPPPFRAAGVNP